MWFETLVCPWIAFAASLACLLFTQRWLQRHIIGLGLLAFGTQDDGIILYYTVMFPGVVLHELSHLLVASLLRVRTRRFVILPVRDEKSILLGHVEIEKTDAVRAALIGAAPLLTGLLMLALVADKAFNLSDLAAALPAGDLAVIRPAIERLIRRPDFWIWLYFTFTIANAMMPSPEDRRSWPAFIGGVFVVVLVMFAAGLQDAVVDTLTGPTASALNALAAIFFAIFALNVLAIVLVWILEWSASHIAGKSVNYKPLQEPATDAMQPTPARRPVPLHERPLPVPEPPRNAPPVEVEAPHPPVPMFDDGSDDEALDAF